MEIRIRNISKSFGGFKALDGVDVDIRDLSFTAVLGPSGCGKTTLLRVLAGLEAPDGGELYFGDTCVFSSANGVSVPPDKRGVGMVFQDFALWPHMTVFENVAFPLRAAGVRKGLREQVEQAVSRVRLEGLETRYPQELSGGQQQRVAIARAMIGHPGVLLFDEPFSSLDVKLREEMRVELLTLVSGLQTTAVFVTHDQSEALSMADDILLLRGGRVVQAGTPEELYAGPADAFAADFIGGCDFLPQERQMVRPEKVRLAEEGKGKLPGVVRACLFVGGRYELHVSVGSGEWRLYSSRKWAKGETVGLDFSEQDVIEVGRGSAGA